MPAEWEPHLSTWLAWPHRNSDWPGKFPTIPWIYGEIIRILSRYEPVNVLVRNPPERDTAKQLLSRVDANLNQIFFHTCRNDRGWLRDSGPTFVRARDGKKVALDWMFTAWAKYPDWSIDDRIAGFIARKVNAPSVQPYHNSWRVVLEGGAIDVNGQGALLATEECLLDTVQQRNPPMGKDEYAYTFQQFLGIDQVIWLGKGIVGDDTHGHIDDISRFVSGNRVLTVVEDNPDDPNYRPLQENREILQAVRLSNGEKLEVVPLPMPKPLVFRGQRLPASYANFYIANGVVIVPTFNDPADRLALGIIAEQFPDRDVVGIHCVDLVWGLGTLHCMTQQEPAMN